MMDAEQSLSVPTAASARAAEDADASRQGYFVLAIFAGTFLFIAGVVLVSSRPPSITLTATTLAIRSSGYASTVPVAEIVEVQMVRQLSGLGRKQNGFQFGSAYAGRFEMKPYGSATLFVNVSRPPYVRVRTTSRVVFVNAGDSVATRALYDSLAARRSAP